MTLAANATGMGINPLMLSWINQVPKEVCHRFSRIVLGKGWCGSVPSTLCKRPSQKENRALVEREGVK